VGWQKLVLVRGTTCDANGVPVILTDPRRGLDERHYATEPSGRFATCLIEVLESPPYRGLGGSTRKVISPVEIELGHHGGNDNGRLPVTTNNFVECGMHRTSVAPAIREAEALGSFVSPNVDAKVMPSTAHQICFS
jgi:hypothetical protein